MVLPKGSHLRRRDSLLARLALACVILLPVAPPSTAQEVKQASRPTAITSPATTSPATTSPATTSPAASVGQSSAIESPLGSRKIDCQLSVLDCTPTTYEKLQANWPGLQSCFKPELVTNVRRPEPNAVEHNLRKWDVGLLQVDTDEGTLVARGSWDKPATVSTNPHAGATYDNLKVPSALVVDRDGLMSLRNHPDFNCLTTPQVSAVSGQEMSITLRPATLGIRSLGSAAELTFHLQPVALADDSIQLAMKFEVNPESANPEGRTSETKPSVSFQESLPSGQTLVIGGLKIRGEDQDRRLVVCITATLGGMDDRPAQTQTQPRYAIEAPHPVLFVLGPLTEGPSKVDPLSDDEILRSFEKSQPLENDSLPRDRLPRFELEKIADRTEAARFIPLIGMARLQHTIYECTFTMEECPGVVEKLTIDHNHFELIEVPLAERR